MPDLIGMMTGYMHSEEPFVLLTVLRRTGSAPRGAGAHMLVTKDGRTFGTIGGGAVEYEAEQQAKLVLEERRSCRAHYCLNQNDVQDLGMVCGGEVDVAFCYVDPADDKSREWISAAEKQQAQGESVWLILDITEEAQIDPAVYGRKSGLTGRLVSDKVTEELSTAAGTIEEGGRTYYYERLTRTGKVYIFGGGHVAQALVPALTAVDFPCVVLEDREEFCRPELFPGAVGVLHIDTQRIADSVTVTEEDYVCVMTRGHKDDTLVQEQILQTPAAYIGVIGSRKKKAKVFGELKKAGFTEIDLARITTPIGLDIQAETPAEIAVSIAAQMIQVRAGAGGSGSLADGKPEPSVAEAAKRTRTEAETAAEQTTVAEATTAAPGAVIIAAGTGEHNSAPQALQTVEGMSLAEYVTVNFQRAGVKDIVMVTGEQDEELKKQLKGFGVTFLKNDFYKTSEMLDSVKIGLAYLQDRCDKIFLCPVNVPFFSAESVEKLLAGTSEVVIPSYNHRGGHPIALGASVIPDILDYTGENGLRGAIRSLGIQPEYIELEDAGVVHPLREGGKDEETSLRYLDNMKRAQSKVRLINAKPYFGPGTVTLLRQIHSLGSVREASQKTGISYSKAWTMIRTAEAESGMELVARQAGGKFGGMAAVTETGLELIRRFEELEREVQQFTDEKYREIFVSLQRN